MLMRVCYDVILGLTMPDWSLTRINELLVPAQTQGLTQWDLPASDYPTSTVLKLSIQSLNFGIWRDIFEFKTW